MKDENDNPNWMDDNVFVVFFVSCNMNVEKKAGNNDDKQFGKCFVAKVDDGSKICFRIIGIAVH